MYQSLCVTARASSQAEMLLHSKEQINTESHQVNTRSASVDRTNTVSDCLEQWHSFRKHLQLAQIPLTVAGHVFRKERQSETSKKCWVVLERTSWQRWDKDLLCVVWFITLWKLLFFLQYSLNAWTANKTKPSAWWKNDIFPALTFKWPFAIFTSLKSLPWYNFLNSPSSLYTCQIASDLTSLFAFLFTFQFDSWKSSSYVRLKGY